MFAISRFLGKQPYFFLWLRGNNIEDDVSEKFAYYLETIGKNVILQNNRMDLSPFYELGNGKCLLHLTVLQGSPNVHKIFLNSDTLLSLEVALSGSDNNILEAVKSCKRLRRLSVHFGEHFELFKEFEFLSQTKIEDFTIKGTQTSFEKLSLAVEVKAFAKILLGMPFLKKLVFLPELYPGMTDQLLLAFAKLLPYLEVKEFAYSDCSINVEETLKEAAKKSGCKCEKYEEPVSMFEIYDKKANEKPLIERVMENKSDTLEISEQYVWHEEEKVIEEVLQSNLDLKKLILDYDLSGEQLERFIEILPKTNIEVLKICGGEIEGVNYMCTVEDNLPKTKIKELAIENSLNFGEKLLITFEFLEQSQIEKLSLIEKMKADTLVNLATNLAKSTKIVELQLYLVSTSDETLKILWENICKSQVKKLTLISNELKTYSMGYLPELLQKSKLEFVVLKNFALDAETHNLCLESLSKSQVKYFRDVNKIVKFTEESQAFEVISPLSDAVVEVERYQAARAQKIFRMASRA